MQPDNNQPNQPMSGAEANPSEPVQQPAVAPSETPVATEPATAAVPNSTVTPPQQTPLGTQSTSTPSAQPPVAAAKKNAFKKLGIVPVVAIAAFLLFGGAAAAYFGVVVPNKPENVWKTSLENTGKGFDKLLTYTQQQKDVKGSKASGSFKVESSDVVIDGTFEGKTYEKNGSYKADVGAAGARINAEILSNVPEGSTSPDVYFKVKGVASISSLLGAESPELSAQLSQLDNQWYVIDHTLFDQVQASATQSKDGKTPQLTAEDIVAIQAAITKVNNEYFFTADPSKAVLKVSTTVGKETVDGRSMYHYQVTFDKEHLKTYVTAMKDELKKTKLGELYAQDGQTFEEAIQFDELIKSIDEMKEDQKADVWADISTKLIRKIKFTSNEKETTSLEIALNYNGGSTFPFVFTIKSDDPNDKGELSLKVEIDTQKRSTLLEANADVTTEGQNTKFNVKATAEVNTEPVEFNKPADAVSVYELLGGFMPGASQGSLQNSSGLGSFDL